MFFFKMGLKNVFRQYGRTSLSMVSIIAGVAVLILGRGLTSGFKENIIRAQIDTASGHVLAVPADYPNAGLQHPVDELLTLDGKTRAWLDEHTVGWTARTIFTPRAVVGADAMRVRAFGFDPATDERVFPRKDWQVAGSIPAGVGDGILISKGLGRTLKVGVGDRMILETRTAAGAINALEVQIAGVVSTGSPMIDAAGLFAPMPLVEELVRTDGKISHLALRLKDRDQADAVAAELRSVLGDEARVSTWWDESKGLVQAQDMRQVMLDVIALALVAIAATGIANTVLMAAYERVREVGTLRAMGMTQGGVTRLFVTEGLIMGVVGSLLGATLGGYTVFKYGRDGIDMSALLEEAAKGDTYQSVPMSMMLYMQFSMTTVILSALTGLVVAVLASIYPARLAAAMPPAEAVRAE